MGCNCKCVLASRSDLLPRCLCMRMRAPNMDACVLVTCAHSRSVIARVGATKYALSAAMRRVVFADACGWSMWAATWTPTRMGSERGARIGLRGPESCGPVCTPCAHDVPPRDSRRSQHNQFLCGDGAAPVGGTGLIAPRGHSLISFRLFATGAHWQLRV